MKKISWGCKFCLATVITILSASTLFGQEAGIYRPGDTLRVSFEFSGGIAAKIHRIDGQLSISKVANDQAGGFLPVIVFNSPDCVKGGEGEFVCSYKIPETQASGDYSVSSVRALVDGPGYYPMSYASPGDFTGPSIKVVNSTPSPKPKVNVSILPKP